MNNIRDKFEKQIAIMEANLIHDNDAYFEARPNINTDGYKTIFSAGYKRAWQAATEQSQKEIAELQAREKVLVEALENIIESGLLNGSYKLHTKIDKIAREALANVRGE